MSRWPRPSPCLPSVSEKDCRPRKPSNESSGKRLGSYQAVADSRGTLPHDGAVDWDCELARHVRLIVAAIAEAFR